MAAKSATITRPAAKAQAQAQAQTRGKSATPAAAKGRQVAAMLDGKPATATATAAPPRARPASKTAIIEGLAAKCGLERKQVAAVLDGLTEMVTRALGKRGTGMFVIPGLLRLKVARKPATKAKQGINPFTKEPMTIKAKPARNVVKAFPVKSLSEAV